MAASRYLSGDQESIRTRDGRSLSVYRCGTGDVPVVLEAGMGAAAAAWRPTFDELAKHTTVLAYDRAGLGHSDRDKQPRTIDRLTDDLEDVLESLALPPVVLVGHSYGGLVARRLAARRADLVRALVLVDPTDEAASFYSTTSIRLANSLAYKVMYALARVGLLQRLQARGGGGRLLARASVGLSPERRDAYVRDFFSAASMRAAISEMRQLQAGLRGLQAATRELSVPVTVISAGRTTKRDARIRQEIQRVHAQFADSAPGGRHVVAESSGHYVPIEAPNLVVAEVLRRTADVAPVVTAS